MTKEEQFYNIKKYCQELDAIVVDYKKNKKTIVGHRTFNLENKVAFTLPIMMLTFAAMGALLTFVFHLPTFIACPISIVSSIGTGFGLTNLGAFLIMKGKSKLSLGYARLEMGYFFQIMKENNYDFHKKLMKANSPDEISQEYIDYFIEQSKNYAINLKKELNKYIGNKIGKRNEIDYNKIKDLYNSMNNKNKNKILAKIEKIVNKNNKFTGPWCKAYNECGKASKHLYKMTKTLDEDFEIPDDKAFIADYQYLNKKINHDFNIKCESLNKEGKAFVEKITNAN